MATVYRREDSGSPTYAFGVGSALAVHFDALKTVLKACLVSGYGSKAAAGWSLVAEGPLHIVLANATLSGYVGLTRPSATATFVEVWVSRTFTGVVDNRLAGDGLKTGLAVSNSLQHRAYVGYLATSSAATTWSCVADERTFVLAMTGSETTAAKILSGSVQNMNLWEHSCSRLTLYAGDDSKGNFVACGGQNGANANPFNYFHSVGFTSLYDPSTGLLVDSGSLTADVPATYGEPTTPTSTISTLGTVDLARLVWCSGNYSGELRGCAIAPSVFRKMPSAAARSLGRAANMYSNNYSTPIDLGDSHGYFIAACSFYTGIVLLTDNPEFW